jgi:hypothetical protein
VFYIKLEGILSAVGGMSIRYHKGVK